MGENKLKKELGLYGLIAMAAGGMIAAWMVEIKLWFEMSGSGSFIALATCALFVLPLCFVYAELTAMLPYAGGPSVWVSNAFNWNLGWLTSWLIFLLFVMAMPTVSYGISSLLGYIYPITFLQVKGISLLILVLWLYMTQKEIKLLSSIQNIMFWSTIAISIVASFTFIFSSTWSFKTLTTPVFPNGSSGYITAVGMLVFKFIGFDLIPQLVEETNFPREKLMKAFLGALFITFLIYGLAIIGVGGIVTNEWIAQTDIVDPRVADIIGLHWLGLTLVIMGAITCLTTLSGFWLSAARTLYSGAKQKQFSQVFTAINKNGQPYKANMAVAVISIYFTIFAPEAWVNYIYAIYGLTAGLVYLIVTLSFIRLRKIHPDWNRPYKVKFPKTVAFFSLFFIFWVLYSTTMSMDSGSWMTLGLYFLLGVPLWLYVKKKQKTDPENWSPIIFSPNDKI